MNNPNRIFFEGKEHWVPGYDPNFPWHPRVGHDKRLVWDGTRWQLWEGAIGQVWNAHTGKTRNVILIPGFPYAD